MTDDMDGAFKMQTNSGRLVDLKNPLMSTVDIRDIAYGLSNICRFNGHTSTFYSVAQHSLLVCKLLADEGHDSETQMWGLLHDAHEAYHGDLPTPVKNLLGPDGIMAYKESKWAFDRIIASIAGVRSPDLEAVKQADLVMLATEKRDILANPNVVWPASLPEPSEDIYIGMALIPPQAYFTFMQRYMELEIEVMREATLN